MTKLPLITVKTRRIIKYFKVNGIVLLYISSLFILKQIKETMMTEDLHVPTFQPTTRISVLPQNERNPALFQPHLDVLSLKNQLGLLKVTQFLFEIVCLVLISPPIGREARLFLIFLVFAFTFTISTSTFHLLGLEDTMRLRFNNWLHIKCLCLILLLIFYFISCLMLIVYWSKDYTKLERSVDLNQFNNNKSPYIAAAVLGMFNVGSFAFETILLYKELRDL